MKKTIAFLAAFSSVSALAAPVSAPDTLTCKAVACVGVSASLSKGDCDQELAYHSSDRIVSINATGFDANGEALTPKLIYPDSQSTDSGWFGISTGSTETGIPAGAAIIDFSDGDQAHFFTFKAEDLAALAAGSVSKIPGTVTDGYDWINGYNERSKYALECSK